MGFKPIQTKKFKKYLKSKRLKHLRDKGDHEIWDNPDDPLLRPVTIIGCEKDIPPTHIKTNLDTMGVDYDDYEKDIQTFLFKTPILSQNRGIENITYNPM